MNARFLPYSRQSVDDTDVAAVSAALRGDLLTTGPLVEQFEGALSAATSAQNVVVCSSGTSALHLAMLSLGVGPGDRVIVPTITFLATANVVRMVGAEVVFSDVDPNTGLMTPDLLEAAITSAVLAGQKVRAAIAVHLGGQLCDMERLYQIAEAHGIDLVEDACHAMGVSGIGATKYSSMACFSMHPVKAIATGEGGAVATPDPARANEMRLLRSHGMARNRETWKYPDQGLDKGEPNPWYYEMAEIGWNYRLPDILCALGLSQLNRLESFVQRRGAIAALYDKLLGGIAAPIEPVPHGQAPHAWHLYSILIDFDGIGMTRGEFMRALLEKAIGSQVHYIPLHFQPYYRARYGDQRFSGAERYYSRCLSIPLFPDMTDSEVERVALAISNLVRRRQ